MKITGLFITLACVAVVAACSGGGGGSAPQGAPPTAGQGGAPALDQTVSFTVAIPPLTGATKMTRVHKDSATGIYISPNTGSIAIRLVAVNNVSLAQPPPAKPAVNVPCVGSSTGCSVSIPNVVAAIGTDAYTVTTFAGANGQGAVISTGIIALVVTGSGTVGTIGGNGTQLVLGGYVASIALTVTPSVFTFGTPATSTVVVTPKDAGGATIVGNALFVYPITVSVKGAGFTLGGQGLQPDGTVVLLEPESASPPIVLNYDGTGTTVALNATTQNSAGATVTAPPPVLVVTTPAPTPTPSGVTTLPPSPTPAPTGSQIPSPAPSSVYVLNLDNSIFEFSEPVHGSLPQTPRRGFGGPTVGCDPSQTTSGFGLQSITNDPAGNVYAGTEGVQCAQPIPEQVFDFAPNVTGPGGASPGRTLLVPQNPFLLPQGYYMQLSYDAPNSGQFDVSDDSSAYFIARVPLAGGPANPTLGYPQQRSAAENCFISTGLPMHGDPTCGNGPSGFNPFFDELFQSNLSVPFAVGPDGSLYVVVFDEYADGSNTLFGNGMEAIVKVTPQNQISAGTISAEPAWIEGPKTDITSPAAIAIDPATNLLWVFDIGSAGFGSSTPPAVAGGGAYLLSFPLSAFNAAPGPNNIAPTALLSGQNFGRFATLLTNPLALSFVQPNTIALGNGNVYVANGAGPYSATNTPPPTYNGEVDIYNESVTGIHGDGVSPVAPTGILAGSMRYPLAVTFGAHGTALGTGGLARTPFALRAMHYHAIVAQRRAYQFQKQEASLHQARFRHRPHATGNL